MVSSRPFRAIAIDLYKPGTETVEGYRYVLTVVDLCTKWCVFLPLRTKFPAEVVSTLIRHWIHTHGIPEYILSDRGKEFMGVVTTVCHILRVKQIRTTPYHPRSNGLCESQHKMLTSELKIRVSRRSAPTWPSLLTEISFCNNITPMASSGNLSPFQLVFGRRPRMSSEDICFPASNKPAPIKKGRFSSHVQKLQNTLEGMRFRALDSAVEVKQARRDKHAMTRVVAESSLPAETLKVGMVVAVYAPKPKVPKLTFQWTTPNHIVIKVRQNTCSVRSLVNNSLMTSSGGVKLKSIAKAGGLQSRVVNKKMLRSYPVSNTFFLGAKVVKKFGQSWYEGTVDQVVDDEGTAVWNITWSDFDSEEVDRQQLAQLLCYHPYLDTECDIRVPEVDSFVWYSDRQRPQLGRVCEVDPTSPRPVVVQLFAPHPGAADITRARFSLTTDRQTHEPILRRLTLPQIILRFSSLTARGHLSTKDRTRLARLIF